MDGTEVSLDVSEGGGPCGVWVEGERGPELEMREVAQAKGLHE